MESLWNPYGIPMDGIPMESLWNPYGISMDGCWLLGGWLLAGWLLACCWLAAGWLLAGCWLAGWLAAGWLGTPADGRLIFHFYEVKVTILSWQADGTPARGSCAAAARQLRGRLTAAARMGSICFGLSSGNLS